MDIRKAKDDLREIVKKTKKTYSFSEKKALSKPLFEKIEKETWFKKANTILLYWSMQDEVHTHDFILKWYKDKKILLPAIDGEDLRLKVFNGMDSMQEGKHFKILEPIGEDFTRIEEIDLMIIPGIAFDKENNRLGRGKGYYDRLLTNSNSIKIGICFEFQFFNKIPCESFDIKMDYIIR